MGVPHPQGRGFTRRLHWTLLEVFSYGFCGKRKFPSNPNHSVSLWLGKWKGRGKKRKRRCPCPWQGIGWALRSFPPRPFHDSMECALFQPEPPFPNRGALSQKRSPAVHGITEAGGDSGARDNSDCHFAAGWSFSVILRISFSPKPVLFLWNSSVGAVITSPWSRARPSACLSTSQRSSSVTSNAQNGTESRVCSAVSQPRQHRAHFAQGALCWLRKSAINHHQASIMQRRHFHNRSPHMKKNFISLKNKSLSNLIFKTPLLLADDLDIRNISSTCMIQIVFSNKVLWWNKGIKHQTQHLPIAKESLVWWLVSWAAESWQLHHSIHYPNVSEHEMILLKQRCLRVVKKTCRKCSLKAKKKTPEMCLALWMEPYSL